jgi:hypothetical protein
MTRRSSRAPRWTTRILPAVSSAEAPQSLSRRDRSRRSGRILWGTLAFMVGSAVLILVISRWYLLPALEAARNAAPAERRALAAHARLLLAVVLFIVIAGVLMTFRFGRFFLPRQRDGEPRRPTQYVDAWTESARRMQTPPGDRE